MKYPDITERIAQSMQALGSITDETAANIRHAAQHIANQFVHDQKLIVHSTPGLSGLVDLFCFNLTYRHAETQPGLPAISVPTAAATLYAGSPVTDRSPADALRQLLNSAEIFGNSGDVLLLLSDTVLHGIHEALDELYRARGVSSVYIGPLAQREAISGPTQTIIISLDVRDLPQIHELTLFILNSLGDMIPASVFNFQ